MAKVKTITTGSALRELGYNDWAIHGEPTNSTEYAEFVKSISFDENNMAVESDDISALPTWEVVSAKKAEMQATEDANAYQLDRAASYPSIGDQLDMIFHAGLGGDEFQAAIQAVKDANPKPSE